MSTNDVGGPPPAGSGPPAPPRGPLRRSLNDRVLFGVAGGLGPYLGIDPVIVRIAFVLLALFGGSGVVLYLVGLVVIPEEQPGVPVRPAAALPGPGNVLAVAGAALVVAGGWALLRQLVPGIGSVAGPLVLLAAGALLLVAGRR